MIIDKKDVIWSYIAQFFQIASGMLVLPLILRMLNTNEIAMYYLMLNVGSIMIFFDFGFSGQFARNFSYVFSGARELKAEGMDIIPQNSEIDYHLVKVVVTTSQVIYRIVALLTLCVMTSAGTYYIYHVTEGFSLVSHALLIWLLYSISVCFNVYYMYLNPFLTGKGAIAESRKAIFYSRIVYLFIAFLLLLLKCGLIALVIANLIAPLVQRFISLHYLHADYSKLNEYTVLSEELRKCFRAIWYNAKKLGIVTIASLAYSKSGLFFAGLFLPADQVAAYGLMLQLVNVIVTVSITMHVAYQPKFAQYKATKNNEGLLKDFLLTMGMFYTLFLLFSMFLIFVGNTALSFINSNVVLPGLPLLLLYLIITLLGQNHSLFATIIVTGNTVPFFRQAFIVGFFFVTGTYIALRHFHLGLLGIIFVPGLVELCYDNWKWPSVVTRELNITFRRFFLSSFGEMFFYCQRGFLYGINRFFKK